MKQLAIPRERWIEIYNSVVLLMYFCYEYKNNQSSIKAINARFNAFCRDNCIVGSTFQFEGGANVTSVCYLIIVRIIELVNKSAGTDELAKCQFYEWVFETSKLSGVMSFIDLTKKYDIQIKTFSNANDISDGRRLHQLVRHIRHAVSHFSYQIRHDDRMRFESIDPKTRKVKLDMTMPIFQLFNFTSDFGQWVNNTIHQRSLLVDSPNNAFNSDAGKAGAG